MKTPVSSGSTGTRKTYGFEPRPYGCYSAEYNCINGQGADSAKPYGTPHHPVQDGSHAVRAHTRAIGIGARWGRAHEAGIDRGDRIATDGGLTTTKAVTVECPECGATHVRPRRVEADDAPETITGTCYAPHENRGADFEGCGEEVELIVVEVEEVDR